VVRGVAVVVVLTLVAGATALPKQPVWREAALRPLLELVALGVKGWLPPALAQHIKYG
jgi:membrane protein required for colicin V production